jgi:hypothetical protein
MISFLKWLALAVTLILLGQLIAFAYLVRYQGLYVQVNDTHYFFKVGPEPRPLPFVHVVLEPPPSGYEGAWRVNTVTFSKETARAATKGMNGYHYTMTRMR